MLVSTQASEQRTELEGEGVIRIEKEREKKTEGSK